MRFKSDVQAPWWKASANQAAMYDKAAAGIEAFTPQGQEGHRQWKTVADPSSYLRLFETFPYVALPKAKLHLISIGFTPDGVNPLRRRREDDAPLRREAPAAASGPTATADYRAALGKLVMTRASLKSKRRTRAPAAATRRWLPGSA